MIYRIEPLNDREKKMLQKEIANIRQKYKDKFGRRMPKNTCIFRRIKIISSDMTKYKAEEIKSLHSDFLRKKPIWIEDGANSVAFVFPFVEDTLTTIKLRKSDIHFLRQKTSDILRANRGILHKLRKLF